MKRDRNVDTERSREVEALRTRIAALREHGDRAGAAALLRQLRRKTDLSPGEHRQLFRALRGAFEGKLVPRYLERIATASPTQENWSRVTLALWSEEKLDDLFAWSLRHPGGRNAAAPLLLKLALASEKNKDPGSARAIAARMNNWTIENDAVTDEVEQLLTRLGPEPRDEIAARHAKRSAIPDAQPPTRQRAPSKGEREKRKAAARPARPILDAATVAALRAEIETLRDSGERVKAVAALRRLRREGIQLSPNEHRYLFRSLRSLHRDNLVERYLRRAGRAKPALANWLNIALAFWSEARTAELSVWSDRHPSGAEAGCKVLLTLLAVSTKHKENAVAVALLDHLVRHAPDAAALRLSAGRLHLEHGRPEDALRHGERALTLDPASKEASELVKAAAAAELLRLEAESFVRSDAVTEEDVARLAKILGDNEQIRRVLSNLRTVREAPATRPSDAMSDDSETEEAAVATGEDAPSEGADDPIDNPDDDFPGDERRRIEFRDDEPETQSAVKTSEAISRLKKIVALVPEARNLSVRDKLESAFLEILDELEKTGGRDLGKRTDQLQTVVAQLPSLAPRLARFYRNIGEGRRAIGLFLNLPGKRLDSAGWLEALALALAESDTMIAREFSNRAIAAGDRKAASVASEQFIAAGLIDEAVALWAKAEPEGRHIRSHTGLIRALHRSGKSELAFDRGLDVLAGLEPFDQLEVDDQNRLVALTRAIVRAGTDSQQYLKQRDPRPGTGVGSALSLWVDAMIRSSLLDLDGALGRLHAARDEAPPPAGVELHIGAEIVLSHMRYRRFGDAWRALESFALPAEFESLYEEDFALLRAVGAFVEAPEFYPECVIDVIFDEIGRAPLSYDPDPGHLVTISGSLAQGGSERQTVNAIQALTADPRIPRQTVLVRSVEKEDGFFLPLLETLPVDRIIYGDDWRVASNIAQVLPELASRPRLRAAIDLLPHALREEVVRLCRLIWKTRPAIAHVRQDLYSSALACAVAGVPNFFIHRGSLARDTWGHSPLQDDTVLRPMRHTYRELLARTCFFMVNNSHQGRISDWDWLDWEDHSRFEVVHNIVDFDQLGPATGRNEALRAELGIPPDARVVGGVFRIVSVKRPLLWIEIAGKALRALPELHFIIAGDDGDLGPDVRAYAAEHGFADRLHMPGAVVNIGDWYRAMDLLLLTSDREGLPNVNIEAQHFGVPVVSSGVGGAPETIEDGRTGFLVPPHGGADLFVEAIVRALTDADWREAASQRGPQFVHGAFGTHQAREKLITLYGLGGQPG